MTSAWWAKGRSTSRRSIFAFRSSAVIVSSPTLACSRSISASRASAGRLFSDASPPARNELVAPAAQLGSGRSQLARDQLQVLAPQEPQHRFLLASRRHPPPRLRGGAGPPPP